MKRYPTTPAQRNRERLIMLSALLLVVGAFAGTPYVLASLGIAAIVMVCLFV